MHRLAEIKILQFRNFSQASFTFPTAVTGITGENGVGKTNLLDAVYYLCFTKSYFQNKEINNVQHGLSGFRIEGTWDNEDNTSEMLSHTVCKWKDGRKVVSENDLEYEKITDHIGKYTAVMIAPDDVTLINDSSEQRRKFMDGLLAQSQPEYLQHLLAYQKVLSQRNACLKMVSPNHNLLDVYDQTLAKHGLVLIKARQRLAEEFPELVQTVYSRLSAGKELVTLQYRSSAQPDALLNALTKSRARDLEAKRTLQGPHTEDWIFCIDGHLLKNQASQGQKKSFLIGLKLAQLKWLQNLGKTPILLLDDIFEKLDQQRLQRLFDWLKGMPIPQILMTHTEEKDLRLLAAPYFPELSLIQL